MIKSMNLYRVKVEATESSHPEVDAPAEHSFLTIAATPDEAEALVKKKLSGVTYTVILTERVRDWEQLDGKMNLDTYITL